MSSKNLKSQEFQISLIDKIGRFQYNPIDTFNINEY